jgi:NADH:ubiquinone oxidoreductase subunit E
VAEVHEVATFCAHFDVVADGEQRPKSVTVRVCGMLAGAETLIATLQADAIPRARIVRAPCIGSCRTASAAMSDIITSIIPRRRNSRIWRCTATCTLLSPPGMVRAASRGLL